MTEQVFRPTAGPGASRNAHSHSAAYERLYYRSDPLDVPLEDLLSILGNKFRTHQCEIGRVVSVVFVLQFVGELPVLNSRKLGNDVRTTSGQQIVGRTGYDIDIRKDCHRCLCSNRIRP